jgi:Ca-activated chloride channel family protein
MRKTYILFGLAMILLVGALIAGLPSGPPVLPPVAPPPVAHIDAQPQAHVQIGKDVTLNGQLSSSYLLAGQPGQVSLLMDLKATQSEAKDRGAMAIVIDRSGSMAGPKMRQAKRAAKALVERLADTDRIALVTYSSDFAIDMPLTQVKGQRARINRIIDDILDGGGTNLAGGLSAGLKALGHADAGLLRRIILMSDGNANQGLTDPNAIADIATTARHKGISVSTLGVGVDFNEDLMTAIAQASGGGYYYAKDAQAIAAAFDREMEGLMHVVARQVEVSLELAPGVRIEEVYGYRTEKRGGRTVIPVGEMAASERRRVMVRLHVDASAQGAVPVAQVILAYKMEISGEDAEHQGRLQASAVMDASQVAGSGVPAVVEAFSTAEAAKVSADAAAIYAQGDSAQAVQQIRRAAKKLRKANTALNSAKVAAQVQEMEKSVVNFDAMPASSNEGKDLVKREKLRAYEAFVY